MPDTESNKETVPKFSLAELIEFIKDSAGNYLIAKAELTSIEAKEAGEVMAERIGLFIKVAFVGFFTYILMLVALIGIGTKLLEGTMAPIEEHIGTWPIVALILLILHLLLLFIFIDKLKSSSRIELFKISKEELQKDKQWIQQIASRTEK